MNAAELYKAGKLDEAITALGESVRSDPMNTRQRTFLFELLCFSGNLDRAEKQLDALSREGRDAEMGALVYRAALHAEKLRRDVFGPGGMPPSTATPQAVRGTLNGESFARLEDADPRVGPRLEVFAAGQYTWMPYEQIASVTMEAPKKLRDLIWSPAQVRTAEGFQGVELGEVLLPVLTPEAYRDEDGNVRLGRATDWIEVDGAAVPIGQKLLLVDGEAFPILELRELIIEGPATDG